MNTLIEDIQGKPLGPLTPGYNMMDRLRSELEKILPQNAHKLASGKLFLSATCISDRKNMLLSEFDTREELIQVSFILQLYFKGLYFILLYFYSFCLN